MRCHMDAFVTRPKVFERVVSEQTIQVVRAAYMRSTVSAMRNEQLGETVATHGAQCSTAILGQTGFCALQNTRGKAVASTIRSTSNFVPLWQTCK